MAFPGQTACASASAEPACGNVTRRANGVGSTRATCCDRAPRSGLCGRWHVVRSLGLWSGVVRQRRDEAATHSSDQRTGRRVCWRREIALRFPGGEQRRLQGHSRFQPKADRHGAGAAEVGMAVRQVVGVVPRSEWGLPVPDRPSRHTHGNLPPLLSKTSRVSAVPCASVRECHQSGARGFSAGRAGRLGVSGAPLRSPHRARRGSRRSRHE